MSPVDIASKLEASGIFMASTWRVSTAHPDPWENESPAFEV